MPVTNKKPNSRQVFGVQILTNSHPEIKKIRLQTGHPSIHGNKFWKSTYLLMDYLKEFPPEKIKRKNGKKLRVLEIGCGWGVGGIFCAKQFSAELTALDADPVVFPYLQYHAQINGVDASTWRSRYEQVKKQDLDKFDIVVAADICFWDEMTKPLYNLVRRANSVGTRVVITDPGRQPFRDMAEKCVGKLGATYETWSVPHPCNASGFVVDYDPNYQA